jgi:HSP20 family protein
MAIVRYDPWSVMTQLQEEMNKAFNRVGAGDESSGSVVTADWIPAVDIKEEDDRFVLHADIPGVDPKDIEVNMEDGALCIKGERKTESEEEREGYKRIERARGSFYRRFSLPDSADAEKISARAEHGVLEVVIPKVEKVQPRKISVES